MTESEGESVHEMTDALRILERLFLRQNEYFEGTLTGMHSAIDGASAQDNAPSLFQRLTECVLCGLMVAEHSFRTRSR